MDRICVCMRRFNDIFRNLHNSFFGRVSLQFFGIGFRVAGVPQEKNDQISKSFSYKLARMHVSPTIDIKKHNRIRLARVFHTNWHALRQQGIIVVFPAYFTHRVTPVTGGERIALVGRIHGDSYS